MRWLARVVIGSLLLLGVPGGATSAQDEGVVVTTPYPSMVAQPGTSVEFDLDVAAPSPQTVGLSVGGAPEGWTTTLRGGGFVINAVTAGPASGNTEDSTSEATGASLEVNIPARAPAGRQVVALVAATLVLFVIAYSTFMRQEVRA